MRVLFILFFKKGIEAEQGTQKTQKTGKRKSKNDHASAVRVQKLLNRPFFTRGQTLDNQSHSLDGSSRLPIVLLNPGSGYANNLTVIPNFYEAA